MGVIDRKKLDAHARDNVSLSDDELSIASSESGDVLAEINDRSRGSNRRRNVVQISVQSPRKNCGKRKLRHINAVKELRTLAHDSEEVYELGIQDFMILKQSPFSVLLEDASLLKIWLEYTSTSADDTDMRSAKQAMKKEAMPLPIPPAEYKKIDKQIREILQSKSLDVNMVAAVEHMISEFFIQNPQDVLREKRLSCYQVKIKIGVCQYHGVESKVEHLSKKKNEMLIYLSDEEYRKPATELHEYLARRQVLLTQNS